MVRLSYTREKRLDNQRVNQLARDHDIEAESKQLTISMLEDMGYQMGTALRVYEIVKLYNNAVNHRRNPMVSIIHQRLDAQISILRSVLDILYERP